MSQNKKIVAELLATVGIQINGTNPHDIIVYNENFYDRVLSLKNLGMGEAYMDGWWDCERLDDFFCRILSEGLENKVRSSWKIIAPLLRANLFNMQSLARSRMVADRHYNLDNDMFLSFLDDYNQYSCGYFSGSENLAQAQINKMRRSL